MSCVPHLRTWTPRTEAPEPCSQFHIADLNDLDSFRQQVACLLIIGVQMKVDEPDSVNYTILRQYLHRWEG